MNAKNVGLLKEEQHVPKQHSETERGSDRYHVEVLGKALDILDVLRGSRAELRLTDIAEKARLDISTTFRLLRTLEARGYILRDRNTKKFKPCLGYRAYRIGYAQLSSDQPFSQKVTRGLMQAAENSRVELLVADNRDSPEEAVKNAAWLIAQKVDFVIEYEFHYRIGPVLAHMFHQAGIPMLAIDIPMPSAIYFGANNYAAGSEGGEALAQYAQHHWRGRVDCILLLEIPEAGPVPHSRVLGTLEGIRSSLPKFCENCVLHKNGKGTEAGGYLATRRVIHSLGSRDRLLIAAANDNCARGAIRAIHEAGREAFTAVMAQGWGPDEALEAELCKAGSPLVGAVAYFPEKYGARILATIFQYLNGQQVAPASYAEHKLILREGLRFPSPARVQSGFLPAEASEGSGERQSG
jgi:ribose transport system substrate-binding protein